MGEFTRPGYNKERIVRETNAILQKASELFHIPLHVMHAIYDIETLTEDEAYAKYGDALTEIEQAAESMPWEWYHMAKAELNPMGENKVFTKKDIEKKIYESHGYKVFEKRNLKLIKEDGMEDTSYANDMNDLSDAVSDSSTKTAIVSKGDTDNDSSTNTTTIDVPAKTVSDAQRQIKQNNNNPKYKNLGNVNYKVQLENMRKNAVAYSKKELNELLKKK